MLWGSIVGSARWSVRAVLLCEADGAGWPAVPSGGRAQQHDGSASAGWRPVAALRGDETASHERLVTAMELVLAARRHLVAFLRQRMFHSFYFVLLSAQWSEPSGIEAQSLGLLFLQCFDTVGWVFWPIKPVPDMTYNVFGGTLNLAQFNSNSNRNTVLTTDRISTAGNAVASVRFHSNFWTDIDWPFTYIWVMTIALLALKVKIRSQGQTSKIKVKGRNSVGLTSVSIEDIFLVLSIAPTASRSKAYHKAGRPILGVCIYTVTLIVKKKDQPHSYGWSWSCLCQMQLAVVILGLASTLTNMHEI